MILAGKSAQNLGNGDKKIRHAPSKERGKRLQNHFSGQFPKIGFSNSCRILENPVKYPSASFFDSTSASLRIR